MSVICIPESRDLDLQTARPGDPIRVGHCHQIGARRPEARGVQARTPRLAITRSVGRIPRRVGHDHRPRDP